MNDLEAYIRQHSAEADAAEPPVGHERRFQQRLNQGNTSTPWYRPMIGAAAIILVLLTAIQWSESEHTTPMAPEATMAEEASMPLHQVSHAMEEVEAFYTTAVARSFEQVRAAQPDAPHAELLNQNLEKLKASYRKLEQELYYHPNDPRVLTRMIENHKLRLQLLERHLLLIQPKNEQKTPTHEST